MYLHSIRLQNFLSHKDTYIPFEYPMAMSIVGLNGAGKSTIVEGIYYALTGKILRSANLNDVTNNEAEFHRVELTIIHDQQEINIIREYHKNKTNRKKHVLVRSRPKDSGEEWAVLTTRSVATDWNISETLFGLDGESARNTFIVGQNDIDGISTLGPSERRNLLIDLLCEGRTVAKVNKQIQASLKKINQSIGDLTARRLALVRDILNDEEVQALHAENRLLETQIAELESTLLNFHKRKRFRTIASIITSSGLDPITFAEGVNRYMNSFLPAILKHNARRQQMRENLQSQINNLRERYVELKSQVSEIPGLEKEVAGLAKYKKDAAKLSEQRDALIAKKARLEQVLLLDSPEQGGSCPTCGRPIAEHEAEHIRQYRAEAKNSYDELINSLAELEARIKKVAESETRYNKRNERLKYLKNVIQPEFERVESQGIVLRQKLSPENRKAFVMEFLQKSPLIHILNSDEFRESLYAYRIYKSIKREIDDFIVDEARNLPADSFKGEDDADDEGTIIFKSEAELEKHISQLRSKLVKNQYRIEQSENSQKLLQDIEKALNEYREQAEIDNMLLRVLSVKDGAPAMALEESLQQLSLVATQYAVNLANDVLKVEFISRKQTQSGDEVPTLDIQITKRDGVVNYGALSGGERVKIAFAIRVAISAMLLSSRNIQFFILDEAMASLDYESRQKLVALLQKMNIPQIFVITHLEDVASMYSMVAYVTRDGNKGSRVEVSS